MKTILNQDNWNRVDHFKIFSSMRDPYLSLCSKIDISNVVGKHNLFAKILFLVREVCEEIPEFGLRITENGEVAAYRNLDVSFNILAEDKLFSNHRIVGCYKWQEFLSELTQAVEDKSVRGVLSIDPAQDQNLILTSFVPWVEFTSLREPVLGKRDSLPRITWGRFSKDGMMPISIQAHHGLVDGYHIGSFLSKLSSKIERCEL